MKITPFQFSEIGCVVLCTTALLVTSCILIYRGRVNQNSTFLLSGIASLLIIFGIVSHTVSFLLNLIVENSSQTKNGINLGKMISNITVTLYLLIMHFLILKRYQNVFSRNYTITICWLLFARMRSILSPFNQYAMTFEKDLYNWWFYALMRSITLLTLSLFIIYEFYKGSHAFEDSSLYFIWIPIITSTVIICLNILLVQKKPMLRYSMFMANPCFLWINIIFLRIKPITKTHKE